MGFWQKVKNGFYKEMDRIKVEREVYNDAYAEAKKIQLVKAAKRKAEEKYNPGAKQPNKWDDFFKTTYNKRD